MQLQGRGCRLAVEGTFSWQLQVLLLGGGAAVRDILEGSLERRETEEIFEGSRGESLGSFWI